MSEKNELNEQELQQVSGGQKGLGGGLEILKELEKWSEDFNNFALLILDAQKRHPEAKEEFPKLINKLQDPSIPNEEKERLKAEFIQKYILN